MTDVILLFRGEDEAPAAAIAERAQSLGLRVLLAPQRENDELGAETLETQIDDAGALLVCWSESSVASDAIRSCAAVASAHGKLAACRLESCQIPFPFDALPTADLRDWKGRLESPEWRKLVADLADKLRRPGLVDLLRARIVGDEHALNAFAKRFPDDPEARRIWSAREAKYREECATILADARRRLEQRVANESSKIENALQAFNRDFDSWLERERRGETAPKPSLSTLFELWLDRGGRKNDERKEPNGAPRAADDALEIRAARSESRALALQQRLESESGRVRELERRLQEAELQAKRRPPSTQGGEIVPVPPPKIASAPPRKAGKLRRALVGFALVAAGAIGAVAAFGSIASLEQAPPQIRAAADWLESTSANIVEQGGRKSEIVGERGGEDALADMLAARKEETIGRVVAFDPDEALRKLKEVAPDRIASTASPSAEALLANDAERDAVLAAAAKAAPTELFERMLDARKSEAIDRLIQTERVALLARLNETAPRDQAAGAGTHFADAPTSQQAALAPPTQLPPREIGKQAPAAAPPKPASYRIFDNRDLESDESTKLRSGDLQSCVNACRKKESCKAYTFDKWNRICYLKSSVGGFKLNPRSSTGVRDDVRLPKGPSGEITMERYPARAFPGAGYKSFTSNGSDSCEHTCQSEDACVAFTFKLDDGSCRLFKSTGEYFPNELADSGGKRQD